MTHLIISDQEDATVNEIKSFIQQECAKKGVLFVGYHHTSLGHTREDIEYTLEVYNDVFSRMRKALADKTLKDKTEGRVISAFGVRG